jgi:rhamnulokinase
VGVELEQPLITAASLACNLTNEGSPQGRTRFLKIAPGMWLLQQCKQTWERHGGACTYAQLNQLAEQAPRGGAVLDVSYPDFLNPGGMPGRIEAFCRKTGQAVPVGAGAMVRCILESLALQYRSLLNDFESVLGRRLETIHIIGGGSRNGLLNQMTADCTGRPVIAGPVEATAAGNLLVQAMGLGYLDSVEDIRHAVRLSFSPETFLPAPDADWDERYARYRQICASH